MQAYNDKQNNPLFSELEQQRLHMFFDDVNQERVCSQAKNTSKAHTPGGIQINTLIIPEPTKSSSKTATRKHPKRMQPYSPPLLSSSSSSTCTNQSDDRPKQRKAKRPTKQPHELLTEEQKRANHIASEQKRRANIRIGFEQLVDIVPTLSDGHKSEAMILQKSIEYLRHLVEVKTNLKETARQLQLKLGEIPDDDVTKTFKLDYFSS
ncbi:unnamed protein product [Rhizopus microsporus]